MRTRFPALREPMMWLVIGLPLGAILASALLIRAALLDGNDDAVADPVRRTGQIQTLDLGADERARELGLSAVVQVGEKTVRVFPVTGPFARGAPLQLALRHPHQAAADRELRLEPDALGWQSRALIASGHDWNLELAAQDGDWRLSGRLLRGQRAARVAPRLEPGPLLP